MSRLSRSLVALAAVATAALGTVGVATVVGAAPAGTLYRDPDTTAARWAAANASDPRAAVIRDRIAANPIARWFTSGDPATIRSSVSAYVTAAGSQVPVLVAYAIPNRDCGGASAGGTRDLATYKTWAQNFAAGLGSSNAIVILEPDSLALVTCLSSSELAARSAALAGAVDAINAADPNARVYLDAGHSHWNPAATSAARLRDAGVARADGWFSNVSNFNTTADEVAYARAVQSALGTTSLHAVIDTSRNGNGSNGEWCDPAGRAIGTAPTLNPGESAVDAYVWIKVPGEADGCAAGAGTFVPDLAYALATNGGPVPTPTRTPTATATPTATPTASPTASPTGTAGCTVTYVPQSWGTGLTATVTVRSATAVTGWTLTWTFTGTERVTSGWNATVTQTGSTGTARNVSYNGTLPAGGSTSFGFQATGSSATPTGFALNGVACR
jgi:endoglucanase